MVAKPHDSQSKMCVNAHGILVRAAFISPVTLRSSPTPNYTTFNILNQRRLVHQIRLWVNLMYASYRMGENNHGLPKIGQLT